MAKLTIGQKASRVLRLLMGLRNPRIAAALQRHGFDDADLARGLSLLGRLTQGRLAVAPVPVSTDPRVVVELDAWENKWFPICEVVLRNHAPEAHERVFLNLSQTTGPEVIVSVGTFVERVTALPRPRTDGGLGREGRSARDLLAKRGLTDAVIDDARALLARVERIERTEEAASPRSPEDDALAERDLWAWYLEWSTIARAVITDGRLLRQLGFGGRARPSDAEHEGDAPDLDEDEGSRREA
ncbi:hypothetical protein [Sandaracinus amylolyticus]|uniref:hypothetical protein n=1 Tax=Sandaracinus amylolyticus TaxID=927083 RepID=UPI001F1EA08D|nr:hypothetical protein [Sandaracinus amylolyticus]UJR78462.1 Hypothetical protein I5071_4920 [Sandaracinus amylolyticus]